MTYKHTYSERCHLTLHQSLDNNNLLVYPSHVTIKIKKINAIYLTTKQQQQCSLGRP